MKPESNSCSIWVILHIIGIIIGIIAIVFFINICFNHNFTGTDKDGSVTAKKIDGLFSYTRVHFKGKMVVVWRSIGILRKPVAYTDTDGDGKVDVLTVWPGKWIIDENSVNIYRDNSYCKHAGDFDEADIVMKKQIERFKDIVR